MSELTTPPTCEGCSLHGIGRGFVPDSGNFETAKYLLCFEAPGQQEIIFQLRPIARRGFFETQQECDAEIARRRKAMPDVPINFLRQGAPIVGPTGFATQRWILDRVGIKRSDCAIMNVLRCLPPRGKTGDPYPTGEARKIAEAHCRRYDRVAEFNPNTTVVTLHPASVIREVTPLPLVVKDMEKVRDFTVQGRKVMTLLGGKAAHAFLGYAQNVTRWRGDYTSLDFNWYCDVVSRLTDAIRRPRKAKKTTKKALSQESGISESSSEGIQSDSSLDSKIKKTRKRKTKEISTPQSGQVSKASEAVATSAQTLSCAESLLSANKVGGI